MQAPARDAATGRFVAAGAASPRGAALSTGSSRAAVPMQRPLEAGAGKIAMAPARTQQRLAVLLRTERETTAA